VGAAAVAGLALSPRASRLGWPLAFLLAGAGVAASLPGPPACPVEGEVVLEGVVARSPERAREGARVLMNVARPAAARALVTARGDLEAGAGDALRVKARLFAPAPALNPGAPDMAARMRRAGVSCVGTIDARSALVVAPGEGFARGAEEFRRAFHEAALRRSGDAERAALVAALSVGERATVGREVEEAFSASGLAHLLSVSGLHLAVAVLLLYRALRRALLFWPRAARSGWASRGAALMALPATAAYVGLAGAPVPAVRAGIGAAAFLLARALLREQDSLNTLAFAALAILAYDPGALYDPSFQLSFAAMAAVVWLAPRLRESLPLRPPDPERATRLRRAGEWVLMLAITSVAASLATAPITAAYFHRASLVAAVSNLIAFLPGTVIVPVGLLGAGAFAIAEPLAQPFLWAADLCAGALLWLARAFAALPFAQSPLAAPPLWWMAVWAVLLVAAGLSRRNPSARTFVLFPSAAILLLHAAWLRAAPLLREDLAITFLAVGQGDAAVALFPGGATMVVDAGGAGAGSSWDPGAQVVAPYLLDVARARRIDVLAMTHPHPDHGGGLPALLERFPVKQFWHNAQEDDAGLGERVFAAAQAAGAESFIFSRGDDGRAFGDARVEVLHPLRPRGEAPWYGELSENDNSLVLRVSLEGTRFLLAGDIEAEAETMLVDSGVDLRADVVKAPHHCSRTSSTEAFVRATQAKHVVCSVGRGNRWGFPHPEVVARWKAAGAEVWRTDEGAVTFTTDGRALTSSLTSSRAH
jgi:competence protein ComEC